MKFYCHLRLLVLLHCTYTLEEEITKVVKVKNNSFTCLFNIHYEGDTCFRDSKVSCTPNEKGRRLARNVMLYLRDGRVINIKKLIITRKKDKIIGCKAKRVTDAMNTELTTDFSDAYRALVKNLPKIRFGGNPGHTIYRKLLLTGNGNNNTIFPVVLDNDGFANIAAGTYGKGKFLVFPSLEKFLKKWHPCFCTENGCDDLNKDKIVWCPKKLDGKLDLDKILHCVCQSDMENDNISFGRKGSSSTQVNHPTYRVSGINTKQVTAAIGSTLWTDRPQYVVTKMPKDLIGSTLFQPKCYVDISTIEVFSSHKARLFVGAYEGRDGGLMDILSQQGWRLEDEWFVEWNRGEGERLHKIWSTQIDAGQSITFRTTKNRMTFNIFISEVTYRVSGINTKKVTASIGSTLWTDRPDYIITKMPKDLIGSTLFQSTCYVDISTIEVFSSHKARIFVGVCEGRDGGLTDVLSKQGWKLEDGWFVEWNRGEKERLHKIWSTQIDAGESITFTTTKCPLIFNIFISEGVQYSYCRNKNKYDDGEKLFANAIGWMTKKKVPSLASYPDCLNGQIKRVKPDNLGENVDVYIISKYREWYQPYIENYLQGGGNLILGSSDTEMLRSFFLKLGFWDYEDSLVEKTVDTKVMPSSDVVFSNAVRSTLDNIPTKRDTTSLRSETILKFNARAAEKMGEVIIKSPIYKDVLKPLFLRIVEEPALDDHFPDFGSYFQNVLLPTVIQNEDLKSPILTSKLYAPFPPKVEDSVQPQKKVVTLNGTYVSETICFDRYMKRCGYCFPQKWLSTGLYAKQGQLITVQVPEHVVGKIKIVVGCHTDDLFKNNINNWKKGKKFKRPGRVTQLYGKDIVKSQTRLLSAYGGLIYIEVRSPVRLGTFSLEFDKVIESPRFIQGLTKNADWSKMYASSKAPMVELEVPGIIFTIPKITIDKLNPNMKHLSDEYTKIMKTFAEMQGYEMPRPHRYVTDVEIIYGAAHAGYPIMQAPLATALFDVSGDLDAVALNSGRTWGVFHEIGHEIQDQRWTPNKLRETTNNLFPAYINEKLYNSSRSNDFPSLQNAVSFKQGGKKFQNLGHGDYLNIFMMVKHECSWDTFKNVLKYYTEKLPRYLIPNNEKNKFSTIAKVLSKECKKNLIPFFQWWNWPVLKDAIKETKNLPKWDGITDILENAKILKGSSRIARSSSVYRHYYPEFSIDGEFSTTNKMFFHSQKENYPWLEIKLLFVTEITSVTIVNRKDGHGWRLMNAEIRAGMSRVPDETTNQLLDINTICARFKGPGETGAEYNIDCATPITAKYITIQLRVKGIFLQIEELKVNQQYHPAARSSTVYKDDKNNYGPQLSIDGKISTTNKMFFHSKNENYPWLEIKLFLPSKISSVSVFNRKDCCGERLKNVEVRAGMNSVPNGTTNQLLSINTVCGEYEGAVATGAELNIACGTPIPANIITIQLKNKGILQINELKVYQCLKEDNTEYYGNDIGNKKTSGEKECANWCGQTQECRFWTLRKSDKWCWIKKWGFYKISHSDMLSGPKSCAASELLNKMTS